MYAKSLEDSLKLSKQGNDVINQTEAQEQIMTITEITDKQNDEDISEVFFIHLRTLYPLCLILLTYINNKINNTYYANEYS